MCKQRHLRISTDWQPISIETDVALSKLLMFIFTCDEVVFNVLLTLEFFFLKVETLLASFLKDVGISAEQFMTACKNGSGSPQFNGMNRVGREKCHLFACRGFLSSFSITVEFEPQNTLAMSCSVNRKDLNFSLWLNTVKERNKTLDQGMWQLKMHHLRAVPKPDFS